MHTIPLSFLPLETKFRKANQTTTDIESVCPCTDTAFAIRGPPLLWLSRTYSIFLSEGWKRMESRVWVSAPPGVPSFLLLLSGTELPSFFFFFSCEKMACWDLNLILKGKSLLSEDCREKLWEPHGAFKPDQPWRSGGVVVVPQTFPEPGLKTQNVEECQGIHWLT